MHRLAKQYGLAPRDFSPTMLETCKAYSWPGNLRELEIVVKRCLMTGDKQQVFPKSPPDLDETHRNGASPWSSHRQQSPLIQSRGSANGTESLRSLVQSVKSEAERNAIVDALEKTGGNRKAAAGLLRVSYRTLLYKIEQYQLKSPDTPALPGSNGHNGNGPAD
jgi:DNA-binding NtrC family response regulator